MNFGPSNRHWCCSKLMLEPSSSFDEGYLLRITPGSRPPFQGEFLSASLPRPEGPTPQSDSIELAEVLRCGRTIGRSGSKMRARRSVAKAAWAILCSAFGRLQPNRRSARLRTEGLIAERSRLTCNLLVAYYSRGGCGIQSLG